MYVAGDEARPGMSANVPVPTESGWVLRATKVRDADRQGIDFTIAGSARGMRGWFSVITPLQRVPPGEWQHAAVVRTPTDIRIFWNGKLAARRPTEGITLHTSPSNVFVGVRAHARPDREFVGDVRAFRLSSKARYTAPFEPAMPLAADEATVAVLDVAKADAAQVPDGSGSGRHGLLTGATVVRAKK